jgi:hypothetical protein
MADDIPPDMLRYGIIFYFGAGKDFSREVLTVRIQSESNIKTTTTKAD